MRRVPQQQRASKRGQGTVTQKPEAFFYDVTDGREKPLCPGRIQDVDRMVQEIIGLDVHQFKQVLLLPQGEFRAFLLASSADKEKLLEQIFGTGLYKRVTDLLKRQKLDLEKQVQTERQKLAELLAEHECSAPEELKARAAAVALAATEIARRIELTEKQVARAQAEVMRLEKQDECFRQRDAARRQFEALAVHREENEVRGEMLRRAEAAAPLAEHVARLEAAGARGRPAPR